MCVCGVCVCVCVCLSAASLAYGADTQIDACDTLPFSGVVLSPRLRVDRSRNSLEVQHSNRATTHSRPRANPPPWRTLENLCARRSSAAESCTSRGNVQNRHLGVCRCVYVGEPTPRQQGQGGTCARPSARHFSVLPPPCHVVNAAAR